MNSSRLFRTLIMGLTLLACLYFLSLLAAYRGCAPHAQPVSADTTTQPSSSVPPLPDSLPPVEIKSLPLAAMDNTCVDGVPTDLSAYTGMLSGGAAREYLLRLNTPGSLRISVEPEDVYFDVSFVLFAGGTRALVSRDENPAGGSERATTPHLDPGLYRLVVGGYDQNCGPYLLTVRDQAPPAAQIAATEVHRGRNGTVIRWRSFAEVDLERFDVFRVDDMGRRRIAVLRAHGSPAGFANYRFTDRQLAPPASYSLEAVSRDGRIEVVPVAS
jgi:hypothetical protein